MNKKGPAQLQLIGCLMGIQVQRSLNYCFRSQRSKFLCQLDFKYWQQTKPKHNCRPRLAHRLSSLQPLICRLNNKNRPSPLNTPTALLRPWGKKGLVNLTGEQARKLQQLVTFLFTCYSTEKGADPRGSF